MTTQKETPPLSANDVIERLCKLQSEVRDKIGRECMADCFCGKSGFWGTRGYGGSHESGYRHDGKILEFIERAVREKLARVKKPLV